MSPAPAVPEVTTEELVKDLESGVRLQVLDVRAPHRLAGGAIEVGEHASFYNIPGSRLFALPDASASGLDPAVPVAVVCGHGNSSKMVTAWLNERGFRARSVRGGMAAWMLTLTSRPLRAPDGVDHFIQFDRIGKGALAYAIISDGQALLVDAPRQTEPLLAAIADADAELVGVADTHAHADFVSGGPTLAQRLNVPYYLHPADVVYPYDGRRGTISFTAIQDGETIPLGNTGLTVMHTPGHTEGSVTFLLSDRAALTGDFIFVRSIGRPDLAGKAAEWTEDLWASVSRVRAEWPANIECYPAHYGSDSERLPDRSVHGTWGTLARENEPLTIEAQDEFRAWIAARVGDAPDAYPIIKAVNVGLERVTEQDAEILELGKNECAIV